MEVFICTQHPGLQSLAPARGQEKGDEQGQNNLKNKKKFLKYNNLIALSRPIWVGGFVALLLSASIVSGVPTAHAATADTAGLNNIELAKKVIKGVAPVATDGYKQDLTKVTLTLESEDFIQKPLVVETQITPVAQVTKATKKVKASVGPSSGGVHYFPYGYCTYYASQKRVVTWSGNAGTWLKGAKSEGLKTGDEPQVGAIMVTSEGGAAGHVAYVEAVDGENVTISEMNFKGYGIISSRTILASSRFIKGYIY